MSATTAIAYAPPAPNLDLRAGLILTSCCAVWGVGLVMVKFANAGISPFMNAGLRSLFSGLILYIFARLRGVDLFQRDNTLWAGLLCGLLFAIEFLGLYQGLQQTNVSRGTLFLHAAPFVAALGEHFLVPGGRLTRMRAMGLGAAFIGLAVALADGLGRAGGSLTGDVLCLIGGIFWGLTTVVIKTTALKTAPAEKTMLYQLATSVPLCIGASLLVGEAGVHDLTPKVMVGFAYGVLLVVVFGYTTWFWLMRRYSAASLHAFTFLTPIFGAIAGRVILGEPTSGGLIAALILVTAGIWLVNRPHQKPVLSI